jgi:hypothetical protein
MRDIDVRAALRTVVDSYFSHEPGTIRIEELGILNGSSRVDLAVINGSLHGYEIKSAADTLERLPSQVQAFSSVFDTVTLIVADRHAVEGATLIPSWWGIYQATEKPDGSVNLQLRRRPKRNREVHPVSLASLLWRDELIQVLASRGVTGVANKNREALHHVIAETIQIDDLRSTVRSVLKSRENWRPDARRM